MHISQLVSSSSAAIRRASCSSSSLSYRTRQVLTCIALSTTSLQPIRPLSPSSWRIGVIRQLHDTVLQTSQDKSSSSIVRIEDLRLRHNDSTLRTNTSVGSNRVTNASDKNNGVVDTLFGRREAIITDADNGLDVVHSHHEQDVTPGLQNTRQHEHQPQHWNGHHQPQEQPGNRWGPVGEAYPHPEGQNEQENEERRREREAMIQMGHAIAVIQDELPTFFDRRGGLRDTSIYSHDVKFVEPFRSQVEIRGLRMYRVFMAVTYYLVRLWYFGAVVDVTSVQQLSQTTGANGTELEQVNSGTYEWRRHRVGRTRLQVRFSFAGVPRWKLMLFGSRTLHDGGRSHVGGRSTGTDGSALFGVDAPLLPVPVPSGQEMMTQYEGVFSYHFGNDGKVVRHVLERMQPHPVLLRGLGWWLRSVGRAHAAELAAPPT